MNDDEIRQRLSEGDYEAVRGLDLTGEERTLVRDAAIDYPEVAGFAFETYIRVQGPSTARTRDRSCNRFSRTTTSSFWRPSMCGVLDHLTATPVRAH